MAANKKAKKAGAGAMSAGVAAKNNEYLQRLVSDADLRDDLRTAFESSRRAINRANGKGPAKAIDDKKVQKDLKAAASSFQSAASSLRDGPKKRKRRGIGTLLGVAIIGGIAAVALSEDLRKKVLDALFGAEEEFEYSSTTTPSPAPSEPVTS
jgi:hypothetical protein